MKSFLKHYLEHCSIKKIPQDPIPCTPGQKKCIVWRRYRICSDCNGIWAVLRNPKYDIPLDFSRYQENHLTFLNGFFCDRFQILVIKYDPAGVTWPWPWVTGEANKFMVRFFWDWVCTLPTDQTIHNRILSKVCWGSSSCGIRNTCNNQHNILLWITIWTMLNNKKPCCFITFP